MDFSKELEDLFSELNANPYLRLSPAKIGESGNVKADLDWLDGNRLIFRNDFNKELNLATIDLFINNTKALLDKHLGHFNWVEDMGESPEGLVEAYSRHTEGWTQVGLAVKVGENCRLVLI